MNEYVLVDAAIMSDHPALRDMSLIRGAVPLYADLSARDAALVGPWLVDRNVMDEHFPRGVPVALPWRYGLSVLASDADRVDLIFHLESQRSLGMEAGDRYYLRYGDTRALAAIERVLTSGQVQQLKGPIRYWRYEDRFGDKREFGAGVSSDCGRQDMIVLSEAQSAHLLEEQLAGVLANAVRDWSGGELDPQLVPEQYRYLEASADFTRKHQIEPFDVQRHVAIVAVQTGGRLLEEPEFLRQVERLSVSGRWSELQRWRAKA